MSTRARTALVTGMSRGIGAAVARRLAQDGCSVIGCASTPGTAEWAAVEMQGEGLDVTGLDADVSSPADAGRAVQAALDRTGGLDVLVTAAGIFREAPLLDLPVTDWDKTVSVNLRGTFLVAQAAARAMTETASDGRITTIASTVAVLAEPDCAAYNSSKAGVVMLTQSMALELAGHGIAVNCVAPGYVRTEMTAEYERELTSEGLARINPIGRFGRPEEIAHVVSFLSSPETQFLTGATILVDGGQSTHSPRP